MRHLLGFASLVTVLCLGFEPAAASPVETLPVAQIEPGMDGVGFTVFSGKKVESFQVHILGVLKNYGPRRNLILARLEGGPLEETGVIAGMSGSPVYVDDKLVGAVAFSFPFSKEPIAGITPIGEMIEATETRTQRRPAARLEFPLTPEKLQSLVSPDQRRVPVQATSLPDVEVLKPYLGKQLSPIATPASFRGFSPETFHLLTPLLRQLGIEPFMGGAMTAAAGSAGAQMATSDVDTSVKPGDSIGIGLITGDMEVSATGTVTHVDPLTGAVYAFGHPLFNLGPIEYPMTGSQVHLILPSLYSSFKMASSGPIVGTWLQDRQVAIKGKLGTRPRMVPVHVKVKTSRGREKDFHVEVVTDELFTPVLTYVTLTSILQSTERDFGTQTVKVSARVSMDTDRRVIIDDIFAGQQSALTASAMVAGPISFLMTNDFKEVHIEGVDVEIEASESLKTARLVRAWLDRDQVAPGGSVPLKLLLRSYRGEEMLKTVDVEIPPNVEDGKLQLLIADANTIATLEKRLIRSRFEPRNFDQLIRALNGLRKNNRLYVRLSRPDRGGAIVAGEYLSSLPPSVLHVLEADQSSASFIPLYSSMLWEHELITDFSLTGSRLLEINVKSP